MLLVPVAEAAILRAVLTFLHCEFYRRFLNGRELVQIFVMLNARPYLYLP
jgi:hypothetical protein